MFRFQKILTPILLVCTLISLGLLIYSGHIYFLTYTVLNEFDIEVEDLKLEEESDKLVVKSRLMNPSSVDIRVIYIKGEIFAGGQSYGERYYSSWGNPKGYVVILKPESNTTFLLEVAVDNSQEVPSAEVWLVEFHLVFRGVPIVGNAHLTRSSSYISH